MGVHLDVSFRARSTACISSICYIPSYILHALVLQGSQNRAKLKKNGVFNSDSQGMPLRSCLTRAMSPVMETLVDYELSTR